MEELVNDIIDHKRRHKEFKLDDIHKVENKIDELARDIYS